MRKRNRRTGGVAIGPGMDSFDAMAQFNPKPTTCVEVCVATPSGSPAAGGIRQRPRGRCRWHSRVVGGNDMTDLPSDRLSSPDPKCANCKWMRSVGWREPRRTRWWEQKTISGYKSDSEAPFEPTPGKGACAEPNVMKYADRRSRLGLFYVTDLMLCSMWERKE